MSVSLPPPLPPEWSELSMVEDGQTATVVKYDSYRIHLLGPQLIDARELATLIAAADTLSNAIRAVAQAHYDAGYLGAQLRYARNADDLFLLVEARELTSVDASAPLQHYFSDLVTTAPLRDREFEPRRILAAAHAERAGVTAISKLARTNAGQQLQVDLLEERHRRTSVAATYSNHGNRFVGRNLLDLQLQHTTAAGDSAELMFTAAPTRSEDAADDYYEGSLGWNRVTRYGLFGVSGHLIDYKQAEDGARVDGDLEEYQAAWSYPIAATLSSRWIIDLSMDYTSKRRSAVEDIVDGQDEQYPSAQAGIDFLHEGLWGDRSWDMLLGIDARKGLRGSQGASGAALDYFLWRPRGHIKLEVTERVVVGLAVAAQFSSDSLPEQSQWVLGGADAIYAYLPGVAVGDRGVLAVLQAEYQSIEIGGVQLTPRVFVEGGTARYVATEQFPDEAEVTLVDTGIEISAGLRDWLDASLAYARPLKDEDLPDDTRDRAEAGLLFRVTARF